MHGLDAYVGSIVRDLSGRTGRFLGTDASAIRIGWIDRRSVLPYAESIELKSDRARFNIELLTFDRGWVPFSKIKAFLANDLAVEMIESLIEDRNPFENSTKIGPGPAGEIRHRRNRWSCSGSNYEYVCHGIAPETKGLTRTIRVNPEKKAIRNRRYKRWVAKKAPNE